MTAQPVVDATDEPTVTPSLLDAVRDLHRDLRRTRFPLEIPGAAAARAERSRLLDQLSDHLLPRLEQLSTPAVVVAAGSTGAGKSTLVNSVIGAEVSAAGVLRPTTRRPVLVHHPDDADLLAAHPLQGAVDVAAHDSVPRGLALLDAPDLDSLLEENRRTAHRLLEAADLWLFVTTAARYGDALPWRVLEAATQRRASVAMVLNRVPAEALTTIRADLLQRLRERGMDGVPLFTVPDAGPHEGLLDPAAVAPIQRWLTLLAGPDRARAAVLRTLGGALGALTGWVDALAEAVQAQADAAEALRAAVVEAVADPTEQAAQAVRAGAVVDGAAQARWSDLTGRSGALARVLGRSGGLRGRGRTARRRETALEPLVDDLRAAVTAHVSAAGAAGEAALRARLARVDAPAGAAALVADWPSDDHVAARGREAEQAAATWVASGDDAVAHLLGSTDAGVADAAAAAVNALGRGGLAALALAAAAGLEPAAGLLDVALGGPSAAGVTDGLRSGLEGRAREGVLREAESLLELLSVPDLAPDASSRLRLRVAVLKSTGVADGSAGRSSSPARAGTVPVPGTKPRREV